MNVHKKILIFFKNEIQPNSQDLYQFSNLILETNSTHPIGIIFEEISFGSIFSLSKILLHIVHGNSKCACIILKLNRIKLKVITD